jgi:hypothetical protein
MAERWNANARYESVEGLPGHFLAGFQVGDELVENLLGGIEFVDQFAFRETRGIVLHEVIDGVLHIPYFVIRQILAKNVDERLAKIFEEDVFVQHACHRRVMEPRASKGCRGGRRAAAAFPGIRD